ncbi:RNA exonuclease 5-like [Amphiura filiformis]|uniref:RNA exonuclease 5-like n=1 Tax=Amphiura filiformis TaxID=82378 RepID=UPI003B226424
MPRSNRKKKRAITFDNVLDVKEEVSSFLKRASDDCPIPSKRQRNGGPPPDWIKNQTDEERLKAKQGCITRKKRVMEYPKLFLENAYKKKKNEKKSAKPLSVEDVQSLAVHGLAGQHDTTPRWCQLIRMNKVAKVVVLILHGVSSKCYKRNYKCFPHIREHYDVNAKIELKENQSFVEELLYRPMSSRTYKNSKYGFEQQETEKNGSSKNAAEVSKQVDTNSLIGNTNNNQLNHKLDGPDNEHVNNNLVGRSCYLLADHELLRRKFPKANERGIQSTNHSAEVNNSSPMIGVDCEMCTTARGSELTRVSLVDEDGKTLYNSLVKPDSPIVDYVTKYSGITKEMLDPVTTRLKDVQKDIIGLLPEEAILVGQSMENDLIALKLYHPHIIDTSRMFTKGPVALRKLAKFYLNRVIQDSSSGHDSVEDALAALDLAKLIIAKGNNLRPFMSVRGNEKNFPVESIFLKSGSDSVSMMVDSESVLRRMYKEPVGCISTSNDTETRKKAVKAIESSKFLWAQFHSYRIYLDGTTKDEDEQKMLLTKLDGRVKKIYQALPEKSLVITIMLENTRGDDGCAHRGRVFAGIKMSPVTDDS